MQQTTHNVLKMSSEGPREMSLGGWFRAYLGLYTGTSRDGQMECLGDFLGKFDGDVLGTSWGPIFASWESFIPKKPLILI